MENDKERRSKGDRKKIMKCAGVIVTYNRKELLAKNLEMLRKQTIQLDRILIVDNHSTDGTKEYVLNRFRGFGRQLSYIYMDQNTGGAGGFYYGVKRAYDDGYDFIWLMDDDGRPWTETTFEELYQCAVELYRKGNHKIFLNSLVTEEGECLTFGFRSHKSREEQYKELRELAKTQRIYFGKANPFNGTLISREVVEDIGYPNKDFFMLRDETDYLQRCARGGVVIGTVLNSIYHHPRSNAVAKKIGTVEIPIWESEIKEYYWIRNLAYSYKENNRMRLPVMLLINFVAICIWQKKKWSMIKIYMAAVSDAFHNRMGKRKEIS